MINFSLKAALVLALALFAMAPGRADDVHDLDLFEGTGWTFNNGPEFPGAKGSCKLDTVDGRKALALAYDFAGGGAYVAARHPIILEENSGALQFQVKGDRMLKIVMRLVDSTGQVHQYGLLYEQANQWQTFTCKFSTGANKTFGGANDGTIHYPIKTLWFCVAKGNTTLESPGAAYFSDVKLVKE